MRGPLDPAEEQFKLRVVLRVERETEEVACGGEGEDVGADGVVRTTEDMV